MEELIGQVKMLVTEEKTRAMKEHTLFFSRHQGYAILKEEIEEVEEELGVVKQMLDVIWTSTRRNMKPGLSVVMMKEHSISLAAEAIQVAAMCTKFIDSFKEEVNE